MTLHPHDAEFPQPYSQSRYIAVVVLPPLLLGILFALAMVMFFVEATKWERLYAMPANYQDAMIARAKHYDETASVQHSACEQETRLAALAMEGKFDAWNHWCFDGQEVRAAALMREPAGLIVDSFAEEAKPIMDAIRKTAESEIPVWDPNATGYSGYQLDLEPYLNVIRLETYAALRAKDSERVLAALELVPGLTKNLNRWVAFEKYFWFFSARDFHRVLVSETLESGIFDDAKSIDAILEQLDAFDRMGRDRAGLPSPWKDSWLHDVDAQQLDDKPKPNFGQRLIRSAFGVGFDNQNASRPYAIRKGNTGQRFIRVALNIKKYQLLKSSFPSQLSNLAEIGVMDPNGQFSDPVSIDYLINSDQTVQLMLMTAVTRQRSSVPIIQGQPILIR